MTTKILIIDDERDARYTLKRMLAATRFEHQVEEAQDGSAGLRMFKRAPFDLVITDLLMPDTAGFETIGELRRIAPGVKIIAISGADEIDSILGKEDMLLAAKRIGADIALTKPFTLNDFRNALAELLGPE